MNDNDFPTRFAGERLGIDLREGLTDHSIKSLRQSMRLGGGIPSSLMNSFNEMAPENSFGVYDGTQPEHTFGV